LIIEYNYTHHRGFIKGEARKTEAAVMAALISSMDIIPPAGACRKEG